MGIAVLGAMHHLWFFIVLINGYYGKRLGVCSIGKHKERLLSLPRLDGISLIAARKFRRLLVPRYIALTTELVVFV